MCWLQSHFLLLLLLFKKNSSKSHLCIDMHTEKVVREPKQNS